jgi:hypothetical protein
MGIPVHFRVMNFVLWLGQKFLALVLPITRLQIRSTKSEIRNNIKNDQNSNYLNKRNLIGLFGSLEYSIFEFVSDFDLPAEAHWRCKARGVCTGNRACFHIHTLFQAWQAGIRISNLETPIQQIIPYWVISKPSPLVPGFLQNRVIVEYQCAKLGNQRAN